MTPEERIQRLERAVAQLGIPLLGPVTRRRGHELSELVQQYEAEREREAVAEAQADLHNVNRTRRWG